MSVNLVQVDTSGLPDWKFAMPGPLRERLNGLALVGAKTGTFSLAVFRGMYPGDSSEAGTVLVMRGSNGARLALVESVSTLTLPISAVTWEQVESEGESFRSVEHWRAAHEEYWSQFLDEIRAHTGDASWSISDDTPVTYETFRVLQKLPAADAARFPIVEMVVQPSDLEWVSSELYELGTIGIEELEATGLTSPPRFTLPHDAVGLRAGFPSDQLAAAAEAALDPDWQPRFEVLLGDDWLDAWREHFEPTRIGRFLLLPGWWSPEQLAASADRIDSAQAVPGPAPIRLTLDPGRSFGTGAHPTTALSLDALARRVRATSTVLDIGCGSGVLSVAAALLGAPRVVGTDIDAAAVDNTTANARRNRVTDQVLAISDPVATISGVFDVVVANILAPVLIALAGPVSAKVAPGGCLILAGLIDEQRAAVLAAYESSGLDVSNISYDGNWVCLTLERGSGHSSANGIAPGT